MTHPKMREEAYADITRRWQKMTFVIRGIAAAVPRDVLQSARCREALWTEALPGRFLLREGAREPRALGARHDEVEPAERRVAELEERPAGERVQLGDAAGRVQRLVPGSGTERPEYVRPANAPGVRCLTPIPVAL